MEISKQTACRFLLDKLLLTLPHGEGSLVADPVAEVGRMVEALGLVQVDTISVVARNHDLVLHSRIPDYEPAHLEQALYGADRSLIETLHPLYIWPLAEYRLLRQPGREVGEGWVSSEPALREMVLQAIRERGPLSSRDFEGRTIPGGWGAIKDSSRMLQHLWYNDQIYTAHRRGIVRYYDLAERVLPEWVDTTPVSAAEAHRYMAVKTMQLLGLATSGQWRPRLWFFTSDKPSGAVRKSLWQQMLADGTFTSVRIEGVKDDYYLLAEDVPLLEQIANQPADNRQSTIYPTRGLAARRNLQFLAPLDNLLWERGRIADLFGFDYIWEVYTPAVKRRWGYYVLPILYGDQLVGRLDPKAERKAKRLIIHSLTLEPEHCHLADDPTFCTALQAALHRFARFNGADHVQISHASPESLRLLADLCRFHLTSQP